MTPDQTILALAKLLAELQSIREQLGTENQILRQLAGIPDGIPAAQWAEIQQTRNGFHEPDEPAEKIRAAYEAAPQGVTAEPVESP